jgi:hypothetical protein
MRTAFTDLVGCEVPIQLAPMGAICTPRFGFVPPVAEAEGDIEAMAMYAGESAGLVDAIVPAAEIVARTVHQADDLLRAAAT